MTTTSQLAEIEWQGIPGKNPGTSTKVIRGMLKASQKRTKRAPFTEEFMSKHPEVKKTE